ncbi:hypothetical protein ACFL47_01465 [Candidatus Latescibacterota bacterium]
MKEAQLRSVHRKAGLVLSLFIVLQTVTGLVLTVEDLLDTFWGGIFHGLHKRYELAGDIYRLIAGVGIMFMVVTGVWVAMKMRERRSKS